MVEISKPTKFCPNEKQKLGMKYLIYIIAISILFATSNFMIAVIAYCFLGFYWFIIMNDDFIRAKPTGDPEICYDCMKEKPEYIVLFKEEFRKEYSIDGFQYVCSNCLITLIDGGYSGGGPTPDDLDEIIRIENNGEDDLDE